MNEEYVALESTVDRLLDQFRAMQTRNFELEADHERLCGEIQALKEARTILDKQIAILAQEKRQLVARNSEAAERIQNLIDILEEGNSPAPSAADETRLRNMRQFDIRQLERIPREQVEAVVPAQPAAENRESSTEQASGRLF